MREFSFQGFICYNALENSTGIKGTDITMNKTKQDGNIPVNKPSKKRLKRILITAALILPVFLLIRFISPTWTPKIQGRNSISELRSVAINGADLTVLIRGTDKNNPVLIFVHGGPCCSEIPYVRKYQDELEKDFTIVHYDQRGSGRSYKASQDYSDVTAKTHVDDLIALTEYVEDCLNKDKVILLGHSFGTYIATQAAAQRPDLYEAYVGIGQMSDTIKSELNTLDKLIAAAEEKGDKADAEALKNLKPSIQSGTAIVPRDYVRKYGFAARKIDDNLDYVLAFLFGTEYNLSDAAGFYMASAKYQDALVMEGLTHPITEIVTDLDIPVYFVMGKYDGMTSPEAAKEYLVSLGGEGAREMVIYEKSAHYPQFEEKEAFSKWMRETLKGE